AASHSFCTRAMLASTRSRSITTAGVPNSRAISVLRLSVPIAVFLSGLRFSALRSCPHGYAQLLAEHCERQLYLGQRGAMIKVENAIDFLTRDAHAPGKFGLSHSLGLHDL